LTLLIALFYYINNFSEKEVVLDKSSKKLSIEDLTLVNNSENKTHFCQQFMDK